MTILTGTGHIAGGKHRLLVAASLTGEDAVNVAGMRTGMSVYCGYAAGARGYRNGSFSNMSAIKARFPKARYICVGTDVIDIEPGLATPGQGPAFVEGWESARAADPGAYNISKPMLYADESEMAQVKADLTSAGIARNRYYLWLALWNGGPIPAGYDAIQNGNTQEYDSDLYQDYVFSGLAPSMWPLQIGSSGPQVASLQANLNRWGSVIKLGSPLAADGQYGPRTASAVSQAEITLHQPATGTCSQALYNTLAGALPAPTPPPVPTFSVTPSGLRRVVDLKMAVVPGATHFEVHSAPAGPHDPQIVDTLSAPYVLPLATAVVTVDAIGTNGNTIASRNLTI